MPPAGTCPGDRAGSPGALSPLGVTQPVPQLQTLVTAGTPRIYTVLFLPPPAKAVADSLMFRRDMGTPLIHLPPAFIKPPRTAVLLQLFLLRMWLEVAEELK